MTSTSTPCGRSTPTNGTSGCAPRARRSTWNSRTTSRSSQRSIRTHPSPLALRSARTSRWRFSAVVSRACWRGHTSRRRASTTCTSSRWVATSVVSGTGIDSPAFSATTMRTATYRCSKSSTSYRRRSSPTARRSSSTAATSASISGCTTVPSSPRRFARCGGTRTSSAGGWPPTVATTSVPASWS